MNRTAGRKLVDLDPIAYAEWSGRNKVDGKFKWYNLDDMTTANYRGQQARIVWGKNRQLIWGTITLVTDRGFNGIDVQIKTKSGEYRTAHIKNVKVWK